MGIIEESFVKNANHRFFYGNPFRLHGFYENLIYKHIHIVYISENTCIFIYILKYYTRYIYVLHKCRCAILLYFVPYSAYMYKYVTYIYKTHMYFHCQISIRVVKTLTKLYIITAIRQ